MRARCCRSLLRVTQQQRARKHGTTARKRLHCKHQKEKGKRLHCKHHALEQERERGENQEHDACPYASVVVNNRRPFTDLFARLPLRAAQAAAVTLLYALRHAGQELVR